MKIDYKQLRKINPEAARMAVLEYLKGSGGNVAEVARVFGIQRCVIYDILAKQDEGDLTDRSRAPKSSPNKTPDHVEDKVIEVKNKTRFGPKRLSIHLKKYYKLEVAPGTIRHIVRRNKHKLTYKLKTREGKIVKREFVDWYSAKPFEIVQDVNSRFKLIAYAREKTWTNGLCFYLWVISYLRSHGVKSEIIFTVDHGEELGGKSWMKITELRKLISGFGCRLIQNHKGHPEENAHLERSHRTDDDEFYIPRVFKIKSEKDLLDEALKYLYYYNSLREHSSLSYKTPHEHLKETLPEIDDSIKYVIPFILDDVSTNLGAWSGYHLLAQNHLN